LTVECLHRPPIRHFSTGRPLQTLLQRLHSCVDALEFFTTLKALANEAMPQQRTLTRSQKALLQALSSHFEATARRIDISMVETHPSAQVRRLPISGGDVQLRLALLTPAEREIVDLLRLGIVQQRDCLPARQSARTVKTKLTSVYKKFAVRGRSRLLTTFPDCRHRPAACPISEGVSRTRMSGMRRVAHHECGT